MCSLAVLFAAKGAGVAPVASKKFIEVEWDMPDTAFLRQHWQEMERAAPFDGLNFYVAAKNPDGERVDSLKIWDGRRWERDWFTNCIADLKAWRFTKFTENFLRIDATPDSLEWQDDDSWKKLAEKIAVAPGLRAKVAPGVFASTWKATV